MPQPSTKVPIASTTPNIPPNDSTTPNTSPNASRTTLIESKKLTNKINDKQEQQLTVSRRGQTLRKCRDRLGTYSTMMNHDQPKKRRRKIPKSWQQIKNADHKSELDLIIEWLSDKGHFQQLQSRATFKKSVYRNIIRYLESNGFPHHGRDLRGVSYQIKRMEEKFRNAIAWRDKTGEDMLNKAEQRQRNRDIDTTDSNTENYVETARNKIEVKLRQICPYFYELEPVMSNRPAAPLVTTELQPVMSNRPTAAPLATIVEKGGDHPADTGSNDVIVDDAQEDQPQPQITPSKFSPSEHDSLDDMDDDLITYILQSPSIQPTTQQVSQYRSASLTCKPHENDRASLSRNSISIHPSQHTPYSSPSRKRKTYEDQLSSQSLSSKTKLSVDRAVNDTQIQKILESDEPMVQSTSEIPSIVQTNDVSPSITNSEMMKLQLREMQLNVQMREIEVEKARSEADQRRAEIRWQHTKTGAFERAQMMQDFLKSGLSYEKALEATLQFLGPQSQLSD